MSATPQTVAIEISRTEGCGDLPLPSRATPGAAGYDLCAAVDAEMVLEPGARALVPTGFRIAIPIGFEGQVRPRSGLALKHGIEIPNAPGTIDSDYRGELKVILRNGGHEPFVIQRGDRIAQLLIAPVVGADFREVEELSDTDRGPGGFGHTGNAATRST